MQPFKLESIDELFKEKYDEHRHKREWPCGTFYYEAKFYQKLTRTEEDLIGEWLSYNCKGNFVYYKETNIMIAGGYGDNKAAWKQRKRNSLRREPLTTYKIRLDKDDIWLFRMVWVD